MSKPRIPDAPNSIQTGIPLKNLLGEESIHCLARNFSLVHGGFDTRAFRAEALDGLEPLGILDRGKKIATAMRRYLPGVYSQAVEILLASLTPPLTRTGDLGLAVFFYLPHVCFVSQYGLDRSGNGGRDPFGVSMRAQYELTRRFSAEFSIRTFLLNRQARTMKQLTKWIGDADPHVRRLCSEGTRPRLPWAPRIPSFIADPTPTIQILERLKDDPELYVRRSVANHIGDIAKDHLLLALDICERWLHGASPQRRWLIRHALRHPAKKGNKTALKLREAAI